MVYIAVHFERYDSVSSGEWREMRRDVLSRAFPASRRALFVMFSSMCIVCTGERG